MLLDTSGLLCYHDRDQAEHDQALRLLEAPGGKVVHNYVLVEFVALAHARGLPRKPALAFLSAVLKHPLVQLVWVDEHRHQEGMELLKRRVVAKVCGDDRFRHGLWLLLEPRRKVAPRRFSKFEMDAKALNCSGRSLPLQ